MKKVYMTVLGCERRALDAKKITNLLHKNNFRIVDKPNNADIIIFVACAASTGTAEYALKMVRQYQKKYKAELVVGGCLPNIEPEELAKIFNGKTMVTKDLEDTFDKIFPKNEVKFKDFDDENILFENLNSGTLMGAIKKILRKTKCVESLYLKIKYHILENLFGSVDDRSIFIRHLTKKPCYIRISWGCYGNCSYCSIKKGVGNHKSKPLSQCIKELKQGLNEGYKNFIIIGEDVGGYGLDIGSNLPKLLDKLTDIPGEYSISLRDVNPRWVVKYIDYLEKILKKQKIINIDILIQSGSSRILKLMHRYSNTEKMKNAFNRLKSSFPEVFINTHVIVGFPSETEEEFKQTLAFIKEAQLDGGVFFPFSCRISTDAEKIEPKIPRKEIFKRYNHAKFFFRSSGYHVLYKYTTRLFLFKLKKSSKRRNI